MKTFDDHRAEFVRQLLMMLATGWRIGECLAIGWDEVDLDQAAVGCLLSAGAPDGCRAAAAALDQVG